MKYLGPWEHHRVIYVRDRFSRAPIFMNKSDYVAYIPVVWRDAITHLWYNNYNIETFTTKEQAMQRVDELTVKSYGYILLSSDEQVEKLRILL